MMGAAIEFVKTAYSPKLANTESLGHVMALARNIGIDLIEFSDLAKHNLMNLSSGNIAHPGKYEWTSK